MWAMGRCRKPHHGEGAKMVGVTRFERATLWSQTRCASQAALHPDLTDITQIGVQLSNSKEILLKLGLMLI